MRNLIEICNMTSTTNNSLTCLALLLFYRYLFIIPRSNCVPSKIHKGHAMIIMCSGFASDIILPFTANNPALHVHSLVIIGYSF